MGIRIGQDTDLLSADSDLPSTDVPPALVVFTSKLTEMLRADCPDKLKCSISYSIHGHFPGLSNLYSSHGVE